MLCVYVAVVTSIDRFIYLSDPAVTGLSPFDPMP